MRVWIVRIFTVVKSWECPDWIGQVLAILTAFPIIALGSIFLTSAYLVVGVWAYLFFVLLIIYLICWVKLVGVINNAVRRSWRR